MRRLLLFLALLFFAAHVRTLPHTLEDVDSINFAMGVESFDVARHQPHPPGYPIYIGLAKVSTSLLKAIAPGWARDRRAAAGIALWSVLFGALAVFVIADLWRALGQPPAAAAIASVVAVSAPLFWFTAARPLTDAPGLVAALAVQAWLVRGITAVRGPGAPRLPRDWLWAAAGAGLIVGLRFQTLVLTGPLLVWAVGELTVRRRIADIGKLVGAAAIGVLLWAIPLVWDSGGIGAYLDALGSQGQQDFAAVEMLATTPTLRLLQTALRRTFIEPWVAPALANVVLLLAVVGVVRLARHGRPALAILLAAFSPYLLFHLTFQETVHIRYGLPLLVPVSGLAIIGLSMLGTRVAIAGATAIAIASLVVAHPPLEAYALKGSPLFKAFQEMHLALPVPDGAGNQPLVRPHHQVWHGVRRIMDWYRPVWDVGPQPFPFDREWQGIVRHWATGSTQPIWLLADLSRNDVRLFDWRATRLRGRYERQPGVRKLLGGVYLDGLNWWALERPRWMLGTGWSLTPEIAGMTSKDASGPHQRPAEAFLLRDRTPTRVMLGARYLEPGGPPAVVAVALDGQPLAEWPISPGSPWFVQWIDLPAGVAEGIGAYARLTVAVRSTDAGRPAPMVGLEQFDAARASDFIYAFLEDWNELEGNPRTGQLWRWTTARSTILVKPGAPDDLALTLEGESPLRDFDRAPNVAVKAGDRELGRFSPSAAFTQTIDLPAAALAAAGGRVTIETDLTFVPGERNASADRRKLGLKLVKVEVRKR